MEKSTAIFLAYLLIYSLCNLIIYSVYDQVTVSQRGVLPLWISQRKNTASPSRGRKFYLSIASVSELSLFRRESGGGVLSV